MPALLERPKLSKEMAAALKHHIQRERERKRQEEEEADKAINRKKEEQERLRKKAEAEVLSIEETRTQIKSLEEKLKNLQTEKHELFLQLKKVLNEDENRRRQQMKEKNDMHLIAAMGHQYHPAMHIAGPHMIVPAGHLAQQRPQLLGEAQKNHMYRAQQQASPSVHSGINKRARSPSPPVVQLYPQTPQVHQPHYPQGPYGQTQTTHSPYRQAPAHPHYTTAQTVASTTYPVNQPGYPVHYTTSQGNPSKYQARADSAFSSYPSHYVAAAAQQKASEQYSLQVQQQRKMNYMAGAQSTSGMSVQSPQQVEQSTSKGGYAEDGQYHHKLQGQHVRSISSSHALHAQQQSHQPLLTQSQVHIQSQSKPSLLQTYPQRRKPETSMYQPHKKPTSQPQPHQQPPQPHAATYATAQQPRTSTYPTQSQHQQYRY